MRILLKLSILLCVLFSCNQKTTNYKEDFRMQGYLIMTNEPEKEINKKGNDTISLEIDNPRWCFFIPVSDIKFNLRHAIDDFDSDKKDYLYLPMSLTESKEAISFTDFSLKKFLGDSSIKVSLIEESKNFYDKPKTIIKTEDGNEYSIVYIDGLWGKIKIPFKWVEIIPTGKYITTSLDKSKKDGYDYFFLNKIEVLSYDLIIDNDRD